MSIKNYRPISLLPVVSKIFEINMCNLFISHIDNLLSPNLFGFRKGHNTEPCVLVMIEAWRKALDEKRKVAAVTTDLSKAFDWLNYAYGFEKSALELINSY